MIEDQYLDVLQNIEAAIVGVYREHRELADHNVENAVAGLMRVYQARLKERPAPKFTLTELEQALYDVVKDICDWRLGEHDAEEDAQPLNTLDEMVACLKRIRKSVTFWTPKGGRQGYLNYISSFIP
jgi:hypothetical protein